MIGTDKVIRRIISMKTLPRIKTLGKVDQKDKIIPKRKQYVINIIVIYYLIVKY